MELPAKGRFRSAIDRWCHESSMSKKPVCISSPVSVRGESAILMNPRTEGVKIQRATLISDITKRFRRNLLVHWNCDVSNLAGGRVFISKLEVASGAVSRIIAVIDQHRCDGLA